MPELKTKPSRASVSQFIAKIADPGTRSDAKRISAMMRKATGAPAEMWGAKIVGFGRVKYKKDGTEWLQLGFAPRRDEITVYFASGLQGLERDLERLGNPESGKGCLYLPSLAEISEPALERMMRASVKKTLGLKPR
jgi:hypothetical protein